MQDTIYKDGYISDLIINGLKGRALRMPCKKAKRREILLVYGHHSSLERMYGIAEYLSKYANVTMPDLPGFGGMDSFYKIGEKPTLDNFAEYLATFIKMNFRNKKIIIGGMSWGFVIVTRMLQKHPELIDRVSLLFSMAGFTHHDDFKLKKQTIRIGKGFAYVFRTKIGTFTQRVFIKKPLIRLAYYTLDANNAKMKDADQDEKRRRIDFESTLWKSNDFRTHAATMVIMAKLDLTAQKVPNVTLVNIAIDADQYFDQKVVVKHLKQIFNNIQNCRVKMSQHAPTVISSEAEIKDVFTPKIIGFINRVPEN